VGVDVVWGHERGGLEEEVRGTGFPGADGAIHGQPAPTRQA